MELGISQMENEKCRYMLTRIRGRNIPPDRQHAIEIKGISTHSVNFLGRVIKPGNLISESYEDQSNYFGQ